MTESAPSDHPLGPDAPHEDFVGRAFGALGCSILAGLGLTSLVNLAVRLMQSGSAPAGAIDLAAAPAVILLPGTFLACFAAAMITWRVMAPARNIYRQGMLAMVSFFGSFVVSLVAMPVDALFGRAGLAGLALLSLAGAVFIGRRIGRAA